MSQPLLEAIYRRPNTSRPAPGRSIYPVPAARSGHHAARPAWAMGIRYIPMARCFAYLAEVVGWFSRRILGWKLSIAMETGFLHRSA